MRKDGYWWSLLPVVAVLLLNTGCGTAQEESSNSKESVAAIAGGDFGEKPEPITSQQDQSKRQHVRIETEYGVMIVELFDECPQHRDNFIKLAKEGFYDGTIFHRVINGFMIQGGDPESKDATPDQVLGNGGPGYKIPAEFNEKYYHKKGALCAARQGDRQNPKKESSGSQFYVVHGKKFAPADIEMMEKRTHQQKQQTAIQGYLNKPENKHLLDAVMWCQQNQKIDSLNKIIESVVPHAKVDKFAFSPSQKEDYVTIGGAPHLDGSYTVFGQVIEGLDVIDKIAAVECGQRNRPVANVSMKVSVVEP